MAQIVGLYDLETAIGEVRLQIGDANLDFDKILFSDREIQNFLDRSSDNVMAAAAKACYALATTNALVAKMQEIEGYTRDKSAITTAYLAMAKEFAGQVIQIPVANPNAGDQKFTIGNTLLDTVGTMDLW